MYRVYLLQSEKDLSLYIGQTANLKNRIKRHNNGSVPSTREKRPWRLIGSEKYNDRNEARWREHQLKNHSDKKKRFIDTLMSP
ncbi:MAG: GIY-YIG nuclease family protein [Candidatus Vogelbacteria bacterium]|nr:GIY-YIG nuclease family protein [Candidatus Vogelbacteria bacterium]